MPKDTPSNKTSDAVRYHYGYATSGKPTQHCPPKGKAPSRSTEKRK